MKKNYYLMRTYILVLSILLSTNIIAQIPDASRLINHKQVFENRNFNYSRYLRSDHTNNYQIAYIRGTNTFYGNDVNAGSNLTKNFARLGIDGLPVWHIQFHNVAQYAPINYGFLDDHEAVDFEDNILTLTTLIQNTTATLKDTKNNDYEFSSNKSNSQLVSKINKDGEHIWSKMIEFENSTNNTALSYQLIVDNNNDLYVLGNTSVALLIDGKTYGKSGKGTFTILKIDGNDGKILYHKNLPYKISITAPTFDKENNLYLFSEPIEHSNFLEIDDVKINLNTTWDLVMLKLTADGRVTFGKNFYPTSNDTYGWPLNAKFDGKNILLYGSYYKTNKEQAHYLGLSGKKIPTSFPENTFTDYLTKLNINGDVIWESIIDKKLGTTQGYTNIDIDEEGSTYIAPTVVGDLVNIGTKSIFFPENGYTNVIYKFDTNGNFIAHNIIGRDSRKSNIQVINKNLLNVVASINKSSDGTIKNYPVNAGIYFYTITFGELPSKYISVHEDFKKLDKIEINNNENGDNKYQFVLNNNTDWSINSNSDWLTVTTETVSNKVLRQTRTKTSGNGDSIVTIESEPNLTGEDRSAVLTIESSTLGKPIAITVFQTGVLSTKDIKKTNFKIGPNPIKDKVVFSEAINNGKIYSIDSKIILENINGTTMNLNHLAPGIYILQGQTNKNELINIRFIKQ